MTRKTLEQFIDRRNSSGFDSNLQFEIDANGVGLDIDELGKPERNHEYAAWVWKTEHGFLVEFAGKLALYEVLPWDAEEVKR